MKWLPLLCFALATLTVALADEKENIDVVLSVRTEWVSLGPNSAVRVRRALDESGNPVEELPDFDGLSRIFHLDPEASRLGEPILVSYRVEVENSSKWEETVGGRYRGSGRDDNFLFLMRHEDGEWVQDPYGKTFDMGGLSTTREVTRSTPFVYWHPLNRWASYQKPGRYKVYCLAWDNSHELLGSERAINRQLPKGFQFDSRAGLKLNGKPAQRHQLSTRWEHENDPPPSPIVLPSVLKDELVARGKELEPLVAFAEFQIEVLDAEPDAELWLEESRKKTETWPDNRATAARMGLWFVHGNRYLSQLESWMEDISTNELTGLATNPHPDALKLLLNADESLVLGVLHRLLPVHRPAVKPWLRKLDNKKQDSVKRILERWDDPSSN